MTRFRFRGHRGAQSATNKLRQQAYKDAKEASEKAHAETKEKEKKEVKEDKEEKPFSIRGKWNPKTKKREGEPSPFSIRGKWNPKTKKREDVKEETRDEISKDMHNTARRFRRALDKKRLGKPSEKAQKEAKHLVKRGRERDKIKTREQDSDKYKKPGWVGPGWNEEANSHPSPGIYDEEHPKDIDLPESYGGEFSVRKIYEAGITYKGSGGRQMQMSLGRIAHGGTGGLYGSVADSPVRGGTVASRVARSEARPAARPAASVPTPARNPARVAAPPTPTRKPQATSVVPVTHPVATGGKGEPPSPNQPKPVVPTTSTRPASSSGPVAGRTGFAARGPASTWSNYARPSTASQPVTSYPPAAQAVQNLKTTNAGAQTAKIISAPTSSLVTGKVSPPAVSPINKPASTVQSTPPSTSLKPVGPSKTVTSTPMDRIPTTSSAPMSPIPGTTAQPSAMDKLKASVKRYMMPEKYECEFGVREIYDADKS